MKCPHCESTNLKKLGFHRERQVYQCKNCWHKHVAGAKNRKQELKARQPHPCPQCGTITINKRFCSQSWSSTYNNLHQQERYAERRTHLKKRNCKYCGLELEGRKQTCTACNRNNVSWDKITLREVQGRAPYQVSAAIRHHARRIYKNSNRPKYCVNCGYDKHYEVCHIHAITDFPLDTVIAEINDLHNLIALCPNCHWELDHKQHLIEEIYAKNEALF